MTSQTAVPSQPAAMPQADPDTPAQFSLDIRSILALLPDDDALDDWFLRFTAENGDSGYQFEIDHWGVLRAMASESYSGGQRQFNLQFDLQVWVDSGPGGGIVTGNTLIRAGGRGRRASDAGWISPEQLGTLTTEQRERGLPFAPAFVVEIRSQSNSLESQQAKMEEWIAYGVALGWLIDPMLRQVHIYRQGAAPEVLDDPESVSGDPELPGFVFNVRQRVFDLE